MRAEGFVKLTLRAAIRGKDLQLYAEICNEKNTADKLKEQIPSKVPPQHSEQRIIARYCIHKPILLFCEACRSLPNEDRNTICL